MNSSHYVVQLGTGEYLVGLVEPNDRLPYGDFAVSDADGSMQVFQTRGQAETIANIIQRGARVVPVAVRPHYVEGTFIPGDFAELELRVAAAMVNGDPIPGGTSSDPLTGRHPMASSPPSRPKARSTFVEGEQRECARIIALLQDRATAIRETGKEEAFTHPRLRGDAELRAAVLDAAIQDIQMTARGGRFGEP